MEHGSHQARTGCTEWVAKGDCATIWVGECCVSADLLVPGPDHRGEGLIDFKSSDIGKGQPAALQCLLGRGDRAGQHDDRVDTGEGEGMETGQWLQPEFAGLVRCGDEQGGSAVGDLRGVTGGHHTTLLERGLQARQRLQGGAGADTLICGDYASGGRDRDDLVIKKTSGGGGSGPLIGGDRDRIQISAA